MRKVNVGWNKFFSLECFFLSFSISLCCYLGFFLWFNFTRSPLYSLIFFLAIHVSQFSFIQQRFSSSIHCFISFITFSFLSSIFLFPGCRIWTFQIVFGRYIVRGHFNLALSSLLSIGNLVKPSMLNPSFDFTCQFQTTISS